MEKDGIALPASIKKMKASGATCFYTADGRVFDLIKGEYVQARGRPAQRDARACCARASAPVLKNDGAEAWDLGDGVLGAHVQDQGEQHRPRRHRDAPQAGRRRPRRDFRALVIANEGEHFCVGANLFLVVMAAGQKEWDADPRRW